MENWGCKCNTPCPVHPTWQTWTTTTTAPGLQLTPTCDGKHCAHDSGCWGVTA